MPSTSASLAGLLTIIVIGYALGRREVFGRAGITGLNRAVWYVGAPALMFNSLYTAEHNARLGYVGVASIMTATIVWLLFGILYRLLWHARAGLFQILSAGYANAGNLGIPILVGAVGSAAALAPVLVFQLLIVMPIVFVLAGWGGSRGRSFKGRIMSVAINPVLLGALAGFGLNLLGVGLWDSVILISSRLGEFGVVGMLLSFGYSLVGDRPLGPRRDLLHVYVAVFVKTCVSPAIALLLGLQVFGLVGQELLAVVIIAALPVAQSLYIYSLPYLSDLQDLRLSISLSTLVSLPVIALIALLWP